MSRGCNQRIMSESNIAACTFCQRFAGATSASSVKSQVASQISASWLKSPMHQNGGYCNSYRAILETFFLESKSFWDTSWVTGVAGKSKPNRYQTELQTHKHKWILTWVFSFRVILNYFIQNYNTQVTIFMMLLFQESRVCKCRKHLRFEFYLYCTALSCGV